MMIISQKVAKCATDVEDDNESEDVARRKNDFLCLTDDEIDSNGNEKDSYFEPDNACGTTSAEDID